MMQSVVYLIHAIYFNVRNVLQTNNLEIHGVVDFFRPQRNKPDTCLATIEAIYYFFKEYEQHILKRYMICIPIIIIFFSYW